MKIMTKPSKKERSSFTDKDIVFENFLEDFEQCENQNVLNLVY